VNPKSRYLDWITVDSDYCLLQYPQRGQMAMASNTPGYDPVIARSLRHTYEDQGLEWDNSGKNAFYSRFAYFP
jgi:hypothetical protein